MTSGSAHADIFFITTTTASDAASFDVSGVSVYGDHITVRIGSASGLHEIAVHEAGSGTPLGAYTVTPSVPATTAVVPLSPVPHSTSLTITITALGSTPGALDTITFYLPRDTTVPTNIASNVCTGGGYRYGYNTQIKENEIAGIGNHYSALYWEYDPRVARRWNVDPEMKEDMSNYSVLSNSPILRNDPLGNVDNTYEVTDGVSKKIDDKGGDEIDYVHEKTPERKTPFGVLPATERHYATPVGTTFNAGGDSYRGPGERIIGTPAFGGAEADDDILLQALPIAKVVKVASLSMAVIAPVRLSASGAYIFQKHHIIPNAVYKKFETQLTAIGWKQNDMWNLKRLPAGFHGKHTYYNDYVTEQINYLILSDNLNPASMRQLQFNLRIKVGDAFRAGVKLNDYFR